MGYIRHQATILHAGSQETMIQADMRIQAFRNGLPPEWARLIVGPIQSVVNDDWFWVMLPDGSKEGWETSLKGEEYRRRFAELTSRWGIHVAWGDDEATVSEGEYHPVDAGVDDPSLRVNEE